MLFEVVWIGRVPGLYEVARCLLVREKPDEPASLRAERGVDQNLSGFGHATRWYAVEDHSHAARVFEEVARSHGNEEPLCVACRHPQHTDGLCIRCVGAHARAGLTNAEVFCSRAADLSPMQERKAVVAFIRASAEHFPAKETVTRSILKALADDIETGLHNVIGEPSPRVEKPSAMCTACPHPIHPDGMCSLCKGVNHIHCARGFG